jgi:uncharacterized protein (DUF924 family)
MDITLSKDILEYWIPKDGKPDYDKWFLKSTNYDNEIKEKFGDLLKEAEKGKGFGWLASKDSYVAYIILMDQFSRHIYRGTPKAYKNDHGTMIFTELGFDLYKDQLKGYEIMFSFMPYMHTESFNYQKKGFKIFNDIYHSTKYKKLDPNYKIDLEYEKMIENMHLHVIGHYTVIRDFNRFPKRNKILGRISTPKEINYLNKKEIKNRSY